MTDETPQDATLENKDVNLPEFEGNEGAISEPNKALDPGELDQNISAIHDVPVNVTAVLGCSTMQVSQLLKLSRGAVIELDRKVGEAIDIYVNNRLVARGEVVVVNEHLGITMTEIIKSDQVA